MVSCTNKGRLSLLQQQLKHTPKVVFHDTSLSHWNSVTTLLSKKCILYLLGNLISNMELLATSAAAVYLFHSWRQKKKKKAPAIALASVCQSHLPFVFVLPPSSSRRFKDWIFWILRWPSVVVCLYFHCSLRQSSYLSHGRCLEGQY